MKSQYVYSDKKQYFTLLTLFHFGLIQFLEIEVKKDEVSTFAHVICFCFGRTSELSHKNKLNKTSISVADIKCKQLSFVTLKELSKENFCDNFLKILEYHNG